VFSLCVSLSLICVWAIQRVDEYVLLCVSSVCVCVQPSLHLRMFLRIGKCMCVVCREVLWCGNASTFMCAYTCNRVGMYMCMSWCVYVGVCWRCERIAQSSEVLCLWPGLH